LPMESERLDALRIPQRGCGGKFSTDILRA
jgi:hypothetical protein